MLAIIGGRGLTQLANLAITHQQVMRTPYGEPSGAFLFGTLNEHEVIFLARHGFGHTIPPHLVNYRANLWALREHGASKIISVATVGGHPPRSQARRDRRAGSDHGFHAWPRLDFF